MVSHRIDKPLTQVRPSCAVIDLSAIVFNLGGIRKKVGRSTKIMAVLKANAYGHGAVRVSRHIEKRYADYFGVAMIEEGITLREGGISKPIQVFTLPVKNQIEAYFDFNLEPTVCSVTDVELLDRVAKKRRRTIGVHLKIDTGMNRIGLKPKEVRTFLTSMPKFRNVEIKGAFTHFASAEEKDKTFTLQQFDQFNGALDILRQNGIDPDLVHCANSSAILDLPQTYCSMVRPGLSIYGYYPSRQTSRSIPLKPAMSIHTIVAMIKTIAAGESVSYGRRFVASKHTRIATLPFGYADGYSRLLAGKTVVLIRGKRFPVVGTICMDMMMVDVGDADVAVGDDAVLIGKQDGQEITCWDLAERIGTIPYEFMCGISSRVPRIYKNR
jgi:alanine racemase